MKIFSQDLMSAINESQSSSSKYVRFSVDGYYLDNQQREQTDGVTVVITADGYTQGAGNYIDVPLGTEVSYTVSKDEYETEGPFSCTVTGESTVRVKITNLPMWTFTVVPTPDDSTVSMASGSRTSNTGTIEVPQGSTVAYSISHDGMNSYSGSRLIPQNAQETSPISISRTLESTISMNSITPADATISWSTGVGDATSGLSVTAPCTNTVTLNITKDGYTSITRNFPEQGTYLVYTFLGDVVMTKKPLTCTLAASPQDATISMWKEENGVEVPNSRVSGTGSVTINCVMDDDVHWSVEKTNYINQSGHVVIGPNDVVLPPVTLMDDLCSVTITSEPGQAVVTIYDAGDNQLAQGVGVASVNVYKNSFVKYTAVLGGVTVTDTATIISNYSAVLTPSAISGTSVTLIDTPGSSSVVLPYGRYKFVLIGAGAGGHETDAEAYQSKTNSLGSNGGGGGGSGYVKIQEIVVSNVNGQSINCTVGTGGAANNDGGNTSIVFESNIYTADGGKTGFSTAYTAPAYYWYGGNGGSAGGPGGIGGQRDSSGIFREFSDGGNGALAGGNSESIQVSVRNTTPFVREGAIGYYVALKSLENNKGQRGYEQSLTPYSGYPGTAGRGLSSISTDLLTANYFMALDDVQVLYNNMSGGGGGGASATPRLSADGPGGASAYSGPAHCWGGPGAGGGGWGDGTDGVSGGTGLSADAGTAGSGGDGAILYMRIAWS